MIAPSAVASPAHPIAASGATATERWATTLPAPKPVAWGTCTDDAYLASVGAQCAFLTVPLDWNHPRGATIKIAISRVLHTVPASKYQGIMLVNPGGPGGSGLDLATLGSDVPNNAGDAYDWIGFDPRGVGSSIPALSCIPSYFDGPRPIYEPVAKSSVEAWITRSKAYAAACAKNGPILQHMTTEDVAKDMDYLRASLHQKQINYYGFSYGTYLAQVYSTLFPSHVRRMIMDSTVDPRGVFYQDNLDQDVAFQKTETVFFTWLAKYDSVYHLGASAAAVSKLYYAERAKLAAHPAGSVGADEWTDIFLSAGYYQLVWLDIADIFADWVHTGNVADLETAYSNYGATSDNEFAVYLGVQCTDAQWPRSLAKNFFDNVRTAKTAPFETWDNAWFNAPCIYWPAAAHRTVQIDGSHVKSVLMIDETLDAATPYPGSLYVRSLYPGARLIAEPGGTTHAGTLFGDACVDDQIADYIATGALPPRKPGYGADTYCAPLPQPVPDAASASSAVGSGSSRALVVRQRSGGFSRVG